MRRQGKLPGRWRPLHDARAVGGAEPAHGRVPGLDHAAKTGGRSAGQRHPDRGQAVPEARHFEPAGGQAYPRERPQLGVRPRQLVRKALTKMDMTPHFPIYMDYGATTPVDPRVVDAMIPWLREHFGNPASRSHAWGWEAEEAVEKARQQVAELIGADPRETVWTSGRSEERRVGKVAA